MSKQLVERKSYTFLLFLLLFHRPRAMLILLLLLVTLKVFIVVTFATILHCHHHHQMFIISVSVDHYWHRVHHHHCWCRWWLTSRPSSPLFLWTTTYIMSVVNTIYRYGPPLLLWTITDTISTITTVAVLHLIPCESSPLLLRSILTSRPSSALLLWTTTNTMSVVTVRAPVSGVWRTEGLLQRRRRGAVFKQNPARLLQSWSAGYRTAQQPRGVHSSRTEQFAVVGLQSCQLSTDSFSVSRSVNVFMFLCCVSFCFTHRIIETVSLLTLTEGTLEATARSDVPWTFTPKFQPRAILIIVMVIIIIHTFSIALFPA